MQTVTDFGRVLEEKGARYRPGRVYNVFSVRARAFIHLSPPCGPLSCSLALKTALSRVQCVFLPCGVRVRPPLVFSVTQKLHPLVLSVFFFVFFFFRRPHTRGPSKRETKKKVP